MVEKWTPPEVTPEDVALAVSLVAEGWKQTSRKYRMISRLPPGMMGRQALEQASSYKWNHLFSDDSCADQFRRVHAAGDLTRTLNPAQFKAFLDVTSKAGWMIDWPTDWDMAPLMFGHVQAAQVFVRAGFGPPMNGVHQTPTGDLAWGVDSNLVLVTP